jgi:lysyl-tRNA synthetase class 1
MYWPYGVADTVVRGNIQSVINDSKTPSGPAHVGALRGVLIHDAIYRALVAKGVPAVFRFGVDDYDPLDELPAAAPDFFRPYLGAPLCNVPAPAGASAPDMASHYIGDFFSVFADMGVTVESYRMRDVYRSGAFNDAIDRILSKSDVVRAVYRDVSGSVRPDDWHPFQTICENCGRIGTTEVFGYDGKTVKYRCRADLVKWAVGCGYVGDRSPFDGNGKLPWKLEWAAKWATFGITIEGAGKDHTTRGGSRDVAAACLKAIFGLEPPLNIPYEFFLVGGAKMSSSRGVGATAREIADFLPTEILRFLILKPPPNRPVDFAPDERFIVKLFNEFDRLHTRVRTGVASVDEADLYAQCELGDRAYEPVNFQLILALLQLLHVSVEEHVRSIVGRALTPNEQERVARRRAAAEYWLANYARPEERTELQTTIPAQVDTLSASQKVYLGELAVALRDVQWQAEALQTVLFDVARNTPIPASDAFAAVYVSLLAKSFGPRAGDFLSFLERPFVLHRFSSITADRRAHWQHAAVSLEKLAAWVRDNEDVTSYALKYEADLGVAVRTKRKTGITETHLVLAEAAPLVGDLLAGVDAALSPLLANRTSSS